MKEIKASDLRIGNWVSYLGENVVCDINTIWAISNYVPPTIMYQPIPLTEEWLLRLGFEKVEYPIEDLVIPYYEKGCISIEGIDFDIELFNGEKLNIDYVHQIQNIYYALHGEELTINN